jgi:hypothetical protein
MTLPVKKIYVDSRYRTLDSISSSSFKFPLARNLYFPKNTVFYLEDVCIPHTWYTIEAGFNDQFYFRYRIDGLGGHGVLLLPGSSGYIVPDYVGWADSIITLTPNVYTAKGLATEIQNKIGPYFMVSSNPVTNTITITPATVYNANGSVQVNASNILIVIPTDSDLSNKIGGYWNMQTVVDVNGNPIANPNYSANNNYDTNNPRSCNEVLNNNGFISPLYTSTVPYISNFLNLSLMNNIYISSPNLGSYSTLGARGESNILKKVPVTGSYGCMIVDSSTSNHDFLDCSDQCLSTIEFNLKDVKGNLIPLHGSNVSFSIAFSSHNEDGAR